MRLLRGNEAAGPDFDLVGHVVVAVRVWIRAKVGVFVSAVR